jgi:hypothetical protein
MNEQDTVSKKVIQPLACPNCGADLTRVAEDSYETYVWNPETGAYGTDELAGDIEIKCVECGADLRDYFPEGVCNYRADELPEEFTIDQLEGWEHIGRGTFTTYSSLKRAQTIATRKNGVLYTQVDSEISDERVYSKGNHFVNRTGTWAVLYPRKQ